MKKNLNRITLAFLLYCLIAQSACKKENNSSPFTSDLKGIRTFIPASAFNDSTPYKNLFIDVKGDTIVDLSSGNMRYQMFQALNYYLGAAVRDNKSLDSNLMQNLFENNNNAFYDISSLNINGATLNASGLNLNEVLASSLPSENAAAKNRMKALFGDMARLSAFLRIPQQKENLEKLELIWQMQKVLRLHKLFRKQLSELANWIILAMYC